MNEKNNERKVEFEQKIDIYDIYIIDNNFGDISVNNLKLQDHDYTALRIDQNALTVLSGYVARKMKKMNPAKNCNACSTALCAEQDNQENQQREKLLLLKSRGFLMVPSKNLYEIIYQVPF